MYCEPRELSPYATSEDSDKDSVGSGELVAGDGTARHRGPRSKDWRLRQNIPLPPKPDESVLRTSPPPPYYPLPPPPPVPAPRPHPYVNEDPSNCYFQPLSDDEAHLVQSTQAADNPAFEAENVYLEGRRDGDGEAIELQDLSGRVDPTVAGAQNTSAENTDPVATTDGPRRDVVYAIRRESPTNLAT